MPANIGHKVSFSLFSGLTVTADVRHSHVMGRQYLNVLFTPTAAFKGRTEGLCGVMDNDPSNDLKGPDGKNYNDPIQFADSCKQKYNICLWSFDVIVTNISFRERNGRFYPALKPKRLSLQTRCYSNVVWLFPMDYVSRKRSTKKLVRKACFHLL